MQDLTKGPVTKHLLQFAAFMAVTMLFQTLYFLADLYWVGRLGKESIAAVGLAGNLTFIVLALTQTLGVGTTALVSHAAGAKDRDRVDRVFNQSLVMALAVGLVFGVIAFSLRGIFADTIASDRVTAELGKQYLTWFIPAMFLQFSGVAIASALRGAGIIKPTMVIQVATVLLNIVLAPVLIFGWGTHIAMGVGGAAIATFVAVAMFMMMLGLYVARGSSGIHFLPAQWRPDFKLWWAMAKIGLPAGGEFAILSCYMILVYWIIRDFGSASQAGFGIGARLMQAMFLPVVAVAFAAAPIAGQNFGARNADRVKQSFYSAATLASVIMILLSILCHVDPDRLIRLFSSDPKVIAFGSEYLRIISWNFLAAGLSFTSSSIFQGLGNTLPPLISSASRFFLFAIPGYIWSTMPGFQIRYLWYLSVASVVIQAATNLILLNREFKRKLRFDAPAAIAAPIAVAAVE
ncbi:MAG: efflux family protein [Acidobacteriales bacterium]|nr:efflux family protein [Terriglobales bacterium]